MSYSKYERGRFIKSRMNLSILMALGREEINAIEASRIFNLISDVETAGTTHSKDLVKEPFYLKALGAWRTALERRSRDRLVPHLRRLLKFVFLMKIKEKKMEKNEIKTLETEGVALAERAKEIQVIDDKSLHLANEFIHACRQMRKRIGETMDPIIKKAYGLWKHVLGEKQNLEKAPKSGEEMVGPRIATYKRKIEEEARAREEERQRKIEEENRKKEEALQKAAELEKAGDQKAAEEELKKAEESEEEETKLAEEPKIEVKIPETKGTSIKKIWKWRLKNLKLVPREYLKLDEAKIGMAVRSSQGNIEIPGIETYPVDSVSIREG